MQEKSHIDSQAVNDNLNVNYENKFEISVTTINIIIKDTL